MPSKFDFISPDILLREVDESQVAAETTEDGALIIGQAFRGPAMQPVRVKNLDDLYTVLVALKAVKTTRTMFGDQATQNFQLTDSMLHKHG